MDKATKAKWDQLEYHLENKGAGNKNKGLLKLANGIHIPRPALESKTDEEIQVICQQLLASML